MDTTGGWLENWANQMGVEWHDLKANKIKMTQDELVWAVDYIAGYYKDVGPTKFGAFRKDFGTWGTLVPAGSFAKRKQAMLVDGYWAAGGMTKIMPDANTGVTWVPTRPNGRKIQRLGQHYAPITKDSKALLYNTAYFVLIGVPGGVLVGFTLASLLNRKMPFRPLARTIFFLPSIVPQVASALLWLWIFAPQYGLLNAYFQMMGQTSIPWLSDPSIAKISLIIIHLWSSGGVMVIFLAALQDVPRQLYEAAKVDGATWLHELWHITVPMVTPAILFNLITGLIFGFQYFTFAWLLTGGGPVNSTEFYSMYLYRNAFVFFKMGYASAMAWILFLVVVVCTVLLFRSSARWAYYGGGE